MSVAELIFCHLPYSDAQVWVGDRSTALHSWSELMRASHCQGKVSHLKLSTEYVTLKFFFAFIVFLIHFSIHWSLLPCRYLTDMSILHRYTFGKPVAGKLTVNMTVNGVGYYRHEMGHPVIKTMEVSLFIP